MKTPERFSHAVGAPLFVMTRFVSPHEGSRVARLSMPAWGVQRMAKWEILQMVAERLVRDKPMHHTDFHYAMRKFAARYGAKRLPLEPLDIAIGFVTMESGYLQVHHDAKIANYRDEELNRPKYKKMSKEERRIHTVLIEAKGVINGKARIRRSQNY